ncbi:hypothetical protein R4K48_08530 [Brachyspira pulli]|uniref:hypothetical protein n=1 Tax=Brachyspira pulli TaxID=310721 RepID=UPI0030046480
MENKKIVYFDKNIFSILKNEYKSSNTNNFNKIINSKNKFLYVYSYAHIFDLQNDDTNKKEEDFEFMSQIVDNNFIYYDMNKNQYILTNKSIIECFNNTIKFNSIYDKLNFNNLTESFLNVFPKITDEKIEDDLKNYLDLLQIFLNFKIPTKDFFKDYSEDILDLIPNEIKEKDYISYAELLSIFLNEFNNEIKDDKLYKDKRRKFKECFNKLDIEEKQKMLIQLDEFVKNLKFSPYTNAIAPYILSDMINDNLSEKKVKFRNMNIDAQHSNFVKVVDYFVTNDNGLYKKSKELYPDSNILKLEEFYEILI